jgi:hypothetical protein
VNDGDLLSSGDVSMLQSIVGNSGSSFSGDDFKGFKNAWVDFVLDSGVLSFEVISDDDEIDALVSGFGVWKSVTVGVF